MKTSFLRRGIALLLAGTLGTQACASDFYVRRNLVANTGAPGADHVDPNLVNAWGIAFNPYGVVWLADNGTGMSTLYDGTGKAQPLVVRVPAAQAPQKAGKPTGIVFYGGNGFMVTRGAATGPARFIFASEDGALSAWAPTVDPTNAIVVATMPDAIYKGLAVSGNGSGSQLYATDFHHGRVDVYDASFKPVPLHPDAFRDPNLPAGFAPFGIQAIHGDVYVSYAKQDADKEDDVPGPGLGFIDVFSPQGTLLRRLAARGTLNAPWGMALAPAGFGRHANELLVANFGDGVINTFDLSSGHFKGKLKGADHKALHIDGLWGLAFGNGVAEQPVDTLFFTAGPDDEANGLYGRIDVAPGADVDDAPADN